MTDRPTPEQAHEFTGNGHFCTICWRCGCPCHNIPKPDEPIGASCDWGYCDAEAVDSRWDDEEHGWLPVCVEHRTAGSVP